MLIRKEGIGLLKKRLSEQLKFIIEIDKLKAVWRQSYLTDGSRKENSAEHSWHLALMVCVLQEYVPEEINLLHVLKMVLIHDLVEIDAGDTYCYDLAGRAQQAEKERKAAARIFNILPADQAQKLTAFWLEFEAGVTPEARYAAALDRLQPLLLNYASQGKSWQEHQIEKQQVLERNALIKDSSPVLWDYALQLFQEAVEKGYLTE